MNIIPFLIVFVVISIFHFLVEGQRSAGCARPRIENGRAKIRARGKMVYYRCRRKFQRVGAIFAVCLSNGQWSLPPPICIGRGCSDITPISGLKISGEYNGSMLKFTCPAGMKREGPETIYCNGKKWNADQPTCVDGEELQCDFEEEEICGWSQWDKADFEWSWTSGHTPTVNTGPLHDHTFGSSGKGHYLFIESSRPRKPMDTAVLASPLYKAKSSNICFEFWYHMQGPEKENAVGSLEVFVKPESKTLDDIDPEFLMEGNQGENWKRGSIYIENQTEVFQIIIVGTRKEAYDSDIAIDDVRMNNCSEDATTEGETDNLTASFKLPELTTPAEPEVTPVPKSTKLTTSKVVTKPEPPITHHPTTMKPKTKMKSTDLITTPKYTRPTTSITSSKPTTTPTSHTTQMSTRRTVTTTATTKQMVTTPTRTTPIKTTAKSKASTTLRQKTKQTSPSTRTTLPTTVKTTRLPTTVKTTRLPTTAATSRVPTTMTKKTTQTPKPRANMTYSTKMTATKQSVTAKSFQSTMLNNPSSPSSNLFVETMDPSVIPEPQNGTDRTGNVTDRISDSPNDGNTTVNTNLSGSNLPTTPTRTTPIKTTAKSKTSTTLRQKTKQTSPSTRTTSPTTVKTTRLPTTVKTTRLPTTAATTRVPTASTEPTTMTKKTIFTKKPLANITYSTKATATKQTVTAKSFQSTMHTMSSPTSNLFVKTTEPSVIPEPQNGTDRTRNVTDRISDSPNDGNTTVNNTNIGIGRTKPSVGHGDNNSMPLIIGVSCGVTVGVIVITALAYWWAQRQPNIRFTEYDCN